MRHDIFSAYVASIARIASWVLVSAIVYRRSGPETFAILAFIRGTIGILSYTSLGLGPAMVRLLSEARAQVRAALIPSDSRILSYEPPPQADSVRSVYVTGAV